MHCCAPELCKRNLSFPAQGGSEEADEGWSDPTRRYSRCGWLSSDECHELDAAHMIVGLGQRLRSLGMPIDHLGLHFRTLHPHILGRSILWSPSKPVQIVDREASAGPLPGSLNDRVDRVRQTREWVIEHSDSAEPLLEWFDVYKGHQRGIRFVPG